MSFELTKASLEEIRHALVNDLRSDLKSQFDELHHADIAEVLDKVSVDEAQQILALLDHETAAEVIMELDEDLREKLLESLTSRQIAENLIDHIDSDDAADVLSELPEARAKEVLEFIDDEEQADDIEELLSYEEGTVGAIMAKELIQVRSDWSVKRAIIEMRKQAEELDNVFTIYVVDKDEVLVGILPLKDLLFSAESTRTIIKHICETDVEVLLADEDVEVAVERMKKYDLAVMPIVDERGRLVGRVTFDDVMDVMEEAATEDYQLASGISEDVDADDKPMVQIRARLPWLIIGLAGGILSSQIIALYEDQLRIDPKLAFFMPLIAATAGNVGVQSSAIVVQGLASGSIQDLNILARLWKELRVGFISALACGLIIFLVNFGLQQTQALTYTVSIALFTVIITAALFGTVIPLLLDHLKVDPAVATGPFITTLNDITGLLTYFTVGHLMYDMFP